MSGPRWQEPNLARNPFVNERPVRRCAIALWVLFVLVAGAGFWMSRTIRMETGTRVAELARLNAATVADRESAVRLEAELRSADLPAQNERVEFLNRRLAERSFSWNELLETLTAAMPRGVRLLRLDPEGFTRERGRAQAAAQTAATTRVALRMSGEAEETEALLEFVDRLFAHPAFDRPNLSRESVRKDLKIQFDVAVDYLPQAATRATTAATAASPTFDAAAAGTAIPSPSPSTAAAGVRRLPESSAAPAGAPVPAAAAGVGPEGARTPATGGAFPGRPSPSSRAVASGAIGRVGEEEVKEDPNREELGGSPGNLEAVAGEARGGAASSGASRMGGLPAAATPGSGARGGATAPPAPAAGGRRFPENVMPTPLRPYASSIGGGR